MAFSQNFTAGQNPLYPNIVVVTDTSTDADAAITQRRVYVQDASGDYLVPTGTTTDYVEWIYSDVSISLNILTQDQAVSIKVDWLDVNNAILYTLTQQFCLPQYSKQFLYYLAQLQGLTPKIPADSNYDYNTAVLWTCVLGAMNAVEDYDDISASQNLLDRATYLRLNQAKFF